MTDPIKNAPAVSAQTAVAAPPAKFKPTTLKDMLGAPEIRKRFDEMLGKKSAGFLSSLLALYNSNSMFKECEPMAIVSQAAIAASLDLPINTNLGFAAIVPYRDNKLGRTAPQFQMMWRGFVQLAMRSGQYETINASAVYADELESWNPITSELKLTDQKTWKERNSGKASPVGYCAFFRLRNGFSKYLYMTTEELVIHGKKYSKSFQRGSGKWATDFHVMALKTPLKMLLSKFGILSIEMQDAIRFDQAVREDKGGEEKVVYPDNPENVIDVPSEDEDAPREMQNDAIDPDDTPAEKKDAAPKK